jgi:hypothetical protein
MKLSDWMSERQLTDEAMAAMSEADRGTISRVRRGVNKPSWQLATRIAAATSGAVTPNDFIDLSAAQPQEQGEEDQHSHGDGGATADPIEPHGTSRAEGVS